ncbi:MAG: hypothetical protein EOP02_39325, partial [Proteobacteria bacterium]
MALLQGPLRVNGKQRDQQQKQDGQACKTHEDSCNNQQRAEEFASAYNAPHAFGSYEDLLTLPDLDVVYVATPHIKHHENALMLIRGGMSVLGEKPFAM